MSRGHRGANRHRPLAPAAPALRGLGSGSPAARLSAGAGRKNPKVQPPSPPPPTSAEAVQRPAYRSSLRRTKRQTPAGPAPLRDARPKPANTRRAPQPGAASPHPARTALKMQRAEAGRPLGKTGRRAPEKRVTACGDGAGRGRGGPRGRSRGGASLRRVTWLLPSRCPRQAFAYRARQTSRPGAAGPEGRPCSSGQRRRKRRRTERFPASLTMAARAAGAGAWLAPGLCDSRRCGAELRGQGAGRAMHVAPAGWRFASGPVAELLYRSGTGSSPPGTLGTSAKGRGRGLGHFTP